MTARALGFTLAAALASFFATTPARGETTTEREAERLFEEAKQLVAGGHYDEACPKLEESQRLDPALGTQFNLADCYEHTAQPVKALALFNEVTKGAHVAGKKVREKEAKQRADAIQARLPHLTIALGDPPAGVVVTRDGANVSPEELGLALAVEEGEHVIEARAPGKKAWKERVVLEGTGEKKVDVPALEEDLPPPAPPPPKPAPPPPPPIMGTQRVLALGTGAVGLAGLGVGAAFGVVAILRHDDARNACPMPAPCADARAAETWSDATRAGTISTVALVAGAVVAAGGAVLWFTAPRRNVPATNGGGSAPSAVHAAFGLAPAGFVFRATGF